LWAHCLWIFSLRYRKADQRLVSKFVEYRELRLLDKYYLLPPFIAAALFFVWAWFCNVTDQISAPRVCRCWPGVSL
jgi:hypothetical protein